MEEKFWPQEELRVEKYYQRRSQLIVTFCFPIFNSLEENNVVKWRIV